MSSKTELLPPCLALLPAYEAALRRGWSANTLASAQDLAEELAELQQDRSAFVQSLDDVQARGAPITLPDGSRVPRLPGFHRWMVADGEFVGSINARWQPGTPALPPHVLGHIGYAVLPWHRGKGHAKRALAAMLHALRPLALPWVELTANADNAASIRVIEACGGTLFEHFVKSAAFGATPSVRYRILMPNAAA